MAIVAESFLPQLNGVSTTVARLARHLDHRGHESLIVAPGPGETCSSGTSVVRTASIGLPFYPDCRVALADAELAPVLERFAPDVVHLAAPLLLGRRAGRIAVELGVPVLASYHTDVAGFARRYHLGIAEDTAWAMVRAAHASAAVTLAPSTVTAWQLSEHGIGPVRLWRRGVDSARFHPRFRDPMLRRRLVRDGEVLVGYVGRLAREKQVERLQAVLDIPGTRLVIVGDGPRRRWLERKLPGARFVGFRHGEQLSRLVASFDVFVHTGLDETFCQALQEAMAAGVAVVAPAAGGPLDLVRHGVTGFLWSAEAPETLRGAVRQLVADRDLRRGLGDSGRAAVVGRTWPAVLDEVIAHYRRLALPAQRAA